MARAHRGEVPTEHRWHDDVYVAEWAATANDPPHRAAIFDAFVGELDALAGSVEGGLKVLELGSGPGYLAEQLCGRVEVAQYTAVDYSAHMHAIAGNRLAFLSSSVELVQVDYCEPGWEHLIGGSFDAVVSLQAVHEVRRADRIPGLYRSTLTCLRPGGVALIADLVNVPGEEPEGHLLTVAEHVQALTDAGFVDARCVLDLGHVALVRAERTL